MKNRHLLPDATRALAERGCISDTDTLATGDGFFVINRSVSDILARRDILDFPDANGAPLACDRFFDDWFIFALATARGFVHGLFKLREQENDAEEGIPADGDIPGVTVSFISFSPEPLMTCLDCPTAENRRALSNEINRVVAYGGQRHSYALKKYFKSSASQGSYLIARLYTEHIASFAENGSLPVPDSYAEMYHRSISYKKQRKSRRIPSFINALNEQAGYTLCDHERIYLNSGGELTDAERAVILATHTGNVSTHSFAAEVEYHARFLLPLLNFRIPFLGRSIYSSAIRADLSVDDAEYDAPVPFYREDSRVVRRHRRLHPSQYPEPLVAQAEK